MSKRGKKRNFTECEVETLLNEGLKPEDTQSQPAATDLGCSSSVPGTSGVTETSSAPHLPAADARPTGRVLTTAVLQSQEEIDEIITHLKKSQ
ncbi:hypothetical protein MHYP_G00062310 [Metynnis hypsauchen]